ncbi:hypothetical protein [Halomonas sp. N3-2A]|uniref:hypothetical protein n=1 Tax=Halomonas sp. N3-2A TaxID=2014541 RepID=UPI0012FE28EA|nr:hypothetical protein [Halomonas sp. N3-2A]
MSAWFQQIIDLDEEIHPYKLMRLEKEISKLKDEYEKSIDYAYLYGIWGKFDDARKWLRASGGYGPSSALRYAGAAKAALEFQVANEAIRYAVDNGGVTTASERAFGIYIATGICAFNLAREIRDAKDEEIMMVNGQELANEALDRAHRLGLKDRDIQEFFTRSLKNVEKYMADKRRPLVIDQCVDDEQPEKIVLRLEIAADPDDFGDILWDLCDIDYTGIPPEVVSSIVINPVPAE